MAGAYPYLRVDPGVDIVHVQPLLLRILNGIGQQLRQVIEIFSGYRSPAKSVAVGGFATDPHTEGRAVDARIRGRPIGDDPAARLLIVGRGLVTGAQPSFYRGRSDPAHVQLGRSTGSVSGMGGWEQQLLAGLGAPSTPQNLRLLAAWQRAEGGSANFNPLNTTESAHGATNYNAIGVKNYPSLSVGIHATIQTLRNGKYNGIVRDLRNGHVAPAVVAARNAGEFNTWGTGSGAILAVLGANRNLGTGGGGVNTTGRTRPDGSSDSSFLSDIFGTSGSLLGRLTGGLFGTITGPLEFYKFLMAILSPRIWLRAVELAIGFVILLVGLILLALDTGPGKTAAEAALGASTVGKLGKIARAKQTASRGGGAGAAARAPAAAVPKKQARLPRSQLTKRESEVERRKGARAQQAAAIRAEGRKQERTKQKRSEIQRLTREAHDVKKFRKGAMARGKVS